jgi:hypothetical protein
MKPRVKVPTAIRRNTFARPLSVSVIAATTIRPIVTSGNCQRRMVVCKRLRNDGVAINAVRSAISMMNADSTRAAKLNLECLFMVFGIKNYLPQSYKK